jgi:hypothetical protein
MARWFYQRPVDHCDPTELIVAKRLAKLSDEWVVRWGFYYDTDREGDFLILGPTGGVLVLEVKGGELRKLSVNGRWEGPDHDHPYKQLLAEWNAILKRIQENADGNAVPFVAKALCLADLTIDPKISLYKEIDRNVIVDRGDLAVFEKTWGRLFPRSGYPVSEQERKAFLDSWAKGISPQEIKHFITETDRILLRQTTAEYQFLDMLHDNRQLFVKGGPGSGKTWLAVEQAFRYAGDGLQVLLLCYNIALADQLSALVAKRKLQSGQLFRRKEGFDAARVFERLSQPAYASLLFTHRYSLAIFRFLKSLEFVATAGLVHNLRYRTALPDGPDVELYNVKPECTAAKVEEVVTRWVRDGFCGLDEILILSPHGTKEKTSLAGCSKIGKWPLVSCLVRNPGELPLLSINKAKGLDSLAVIMIDTQSADKLSSPQQQMDYFMGSSRARQLLAILHRE